MDAESSKRSALVIFAIGIVLIHLALNIVHGLAHGRLGIGLNTFQNIFVVVVIIVAPLVAAAMILRGRLRPGGALLAISLAGGLVFGVYFHFILPGPDHVTHINLPVSFEMRDVFDVTAVLLALFECLGVLAGVRLFSKS
jgi:hypothetical protein